MRIYITLNETNEKHMKILDYLNNNCCDSKAEILNLLYKVATGVNIYSNAPIEEQIPTYKNDTVQGNIPIEDNVNAPIEVLEEINECTEGVQINNKTEFDDFF